MPPSDHEDTTAQDAVNKFNVAGGGIGNLNPMSEANQRLRRILEERVEKKEEQTLKIEATVFQLANYYFVFQGVILTAIIRGGSSSSSSPSSSSSSPSSSPSSPSSSSIQCNLFWLPLSLSVIGAVLNFGALVMIADKYKESLDRLDEASLILYQHLYGEAFRIRTAHEQHRKKKAWRKAVLVLSMVLFSLFAILNIIGARIIPCTN